MVKIRTGKVKGSGFEYDCQYNLQRWTIHPVNRTAERGYQREYDLHIDTDNGYIAIECKRLAGISWNQLVKFYEKLEKVTPDAELRYLLFKSNRQPCLVFTRKVKNGPFIIESFEDYFMLSFDKHPSTRAKK